MTKKPFVYDANILIDGEKLGILSELMNCAKPANVTDLCLDEAASAEQLQEEVQAGKLNVVEVGDKLLAITEMDVARGLSTEDRSALWLAEQLQGTLLTNDGVLRREAEKRGNQVHGLLWLIEQCCLNNSLTTEHALELLDEMEDRSEEFRITKELVRQVRARIEAQDSRPQTGEDVK